MLNGKFGIVRRHVLARMSGQQMMAAMKQLDYSNSDFFKRWIEQRYNGTITSTACEEMIGCATSKRKTKGNRQYRRPAVCALQFAFIDCLGVSLLMLMSVLMLMLVSVLFCFCVCWCPC